MTHHDTSNEGSNISRRSLIRRSAAMAGGLLVAPNLVWAAEPRIRIAVLDHRDRWTGLIGTREMLAMAGLDTVQLDLNKPADRQGIDAIVLGSFSSESVAYSEYMKQHGPSIARFVQRGGVVLQFTQADQFEHSPPFLPEQLQIKRTDADPAEVVALQEQHMLLRGLLDRTVTPPRVVLPKHKRRGGWESVGQFKGFSVIAAESPDRYNAVILEAQLGRGRFVITALHFDKLFNEAGNLDASPEFFKQSKQFAENIRDYTLTVKQGKAPRVRVDQPYKPAEPVSYVDGAWTLAVMPDTQYYSESHPEHFYNQTQWIADQAEALRIQHVLHVGDVVNVGMVHPEQWEVPDKAFAHLDGRVPYGVIPGNHDYNDNSGASSRDTHLNNIITPQRLAKGGTLVELMDPKVINNQALQFQVNGQKWLLLGLEFGPDDKTLKWADGVLKKYADHNAIIFTHAYLYQDGTRYDEATKDQPWNPLRYKPFGGGNDGEMMWTKVFRDAPNVRMVTGGHVLGDGLGYLVSKTTPGHQAHQFLQNYQVLPEGGQGYLRLYEFHPDGKTVQAKTYSPSLDKYKTDYANQFTFTL